MMPMSSVQLFEKESKKGYFLYIPESVIVGIKTGLLDEVAFRGLPGPYHHESWDKFPKQIKDIVVGFAKFMSKEGPLPLPDISNGAVWQDISESFDLSREKGLGTLFDGTVFEFRSIPIWFGTLHAPAGNAHIEYIPDVGCLTIIDALYTKSQVTRLMRLTRENLHQLRRKNPEMIVELAKFVGILK